MNILIVKTSAIGDVTHTLPALNALRRAHPAARIDWVVEEAAADLVRGHAAVDHVYVARRKSWVADLKRLRLGALREFAGFVRELRRTRYDLLVDFQGLLKSSLWVLLARAKRKAGFGRGMDHAEGSYLFLNERVPPVDMDVHALERELMLLEQIGVPRGEILFDVPIDDDDRATAEALVAPDDPADADRPLVVISPMAHWPTKLWDLDRFAAVADRLVEAGCRVALSGAPADRAALDEVEQAMATTPVRLDGRTTLKTLAAVLEACATLLTTDSGPMHIAAAIGTPVVALFGPTAPWRTGPWGDEHTVLRVELDCSPCLKKSCQTRDYEPMACMRRLTVDMVVDAVRAKVESR